MCFWRNTEETRVLIWGDKLPVPKCIQHREGKNGKVNYLLRKTLPCCSRWQVRRHMCSRLEASSKKKKKKNIESHPCCSIKETVTTKLYMKVVTITPWMNPGNGVLSDCIYLVIRYTSKAVIWSIVAEHRSECSSLLIQLQLPFREEQCVCLSVSTIDKTACHLQKWCLHALYWLTKQAASVYCGTALPAELMPIPKKWHNGACMRTVLQKCVVHARRDVTSRRAPLSWAQRPFKESNNQQAERENTWLSSWKVLSAEAFDVTVK